MRTFFTFILLFIFSIGFSQTENIIGTWQGSKGRLASTKKFSQSKCLTEFYMKENGAKAGEIETDYKIVNDSLIQSWKDFNANGELVNKTELFKIEYLSDSVLKLIGKSGDVDEYEKISSESPRTNTEFINTFYYNSLGLGCISDTIQSPESGYMNCLCFGEINFETTLNQYYDKFGEPARIMDNSDGSKYYIFILSPSQEAFSYIAVQILNNETTVIQLTGKDNTIPFSFSTIKLGDHATYVKQRLGPNYEQIKVEEIDGFKWSYNPFPFSIEFIDMRVYSIRLSKK